MAPEIERITNTFLHTPARIEVARQATASETIEQRLIHIVPARRDQSAKAKRELLRAVIRAEGEACTNAILFCNRKTEVDILAKSLKSHGLDAAPIHGDLDQSQRMKTLDGFRDGTLRFLVASDVAARGLDIPAVSHVFNFDVPSHAEDYVHRIGRTGRAGRSGVAITLATPADQKYLDAIENLIKKPIPRAAAPEGFSLSEAAQQPPREAKGGRDDGRGRGRRRDGGRDERPARPVVQPVDAAAPAAQQQQSRPEGSRHDHGVPRGEAAPAPQSRSAHRRPQKPARERDGAQVVGMGDHMPDFLMRAVVINRSSSDN
jgi:superfamily II DNA/RNA helicase